MSTSDDQKPPSHDGGDDDDRSTAERSGGGASVPDPDASAVVTPADSPKVANAPGDDPAGVEFESSEQPEPAIDTSGGTSSVDTDAEAPESSADSPETDPAPQASGDAPTSDGESGGSPAEDADAPKDPPTTAREPSSVPMTSMLGSVNEARSWLLELPDFEGPLDLLLHLVRRHELDILDIPISFVTEKYLEYLAFMQALDLEVAGDYLVMAATLAYLKSRELVPTEPTEVSEEGQSEDEGPDPREELIARLLEYQKYRAAASDLDLLPIQGRDVFSRGGRIELPPVDPGLAPLTLFRLAEAYNRVLDRARIHKSHDVVLETISVAQRMNQLTSMLLTQDRVEFEGLFLGRTWNSESELRSMLVVTLMSVLELTKLGVIFVHQDTANGAIVIERKATPEEAKQAIADYDENISFGKVKPGVAEAPASGEAASLPEDPPASEAPVPDAEPDSDV